MKTFLNAEWRKLALANYAIDPSLLLKHLPAKTELDFWNNKCYVSLVGFMFLNTSIKGFRIPFHINFEEVNLRFYVTLKDDRGLKRGVVFIKEIVPRRALTLVANTLYGEHYQTLPMRHQWENLEDSLNVEYHWKLKHKWNSIKIRADFRPQNIVADSEEEFITEHYWGYTKINSTTTSEYEVEHPRWVVYPVKDYQIDVEFGDLYGDEFDFLKREIPVSVFLAEGSEIAVKSGRTISR
jgi:uncharacterized protein